MVIKDGYGGKSTEIRVSACESRRIQGQPTPMAELWIEQKGLSLIKSGKGVDATYRKGKLADLKEGELYLPDNETLAYITIDEAIMLRDELNEAIKEMAGL